jgi:hypothetical protein
MVAVKFSIYLEADIRNNWYGIVSLSKIGKLELNALIHSSRLMKPAHNACLSLARNSQTQTSVMCRE